MEDAHLTVSPLADKKNSLFAIFDGHGGICESSKVLKFQLLPRDISLHS
jgi:serine/threonine protein phosphatase PrpC